MDRVTAVSAFRWQRLPPALDAAIALQIFPDTDVLFAQEYGGSLLVYENASQIEGNVAPNLSRNVGGAALWPISMIAWGVHSSSSLQMRQLYSACRRGRGGRRVVTGDGSPEPVDSGYWISDSAPSTYITVPVIPSARSHARKSAASAT